MNFLNGHNFHEELIFSDDLLGESIPEFLNNLPEQEHVEISTEMKPYSSMTYSASCPSLTSLCQDWHQSEAYTQENHVSRRMQSSASSSKLSSMDSPATKRKPAQTNTWHKQSRHKSFDSSNEDSFETESQGLDPLYGQFVSSDISPPLHPYPTSVQLPTSEIDCKQLEFMYMGTGQYFDHALDSLLSNHQTQEISFQRDKMIDTPEGYMVTSSSDPSLYSLNDGDLIQFSDSDYLSSSAPKGSIYSKPSTSSTKPNLQDCSKRNFLSNSKDSNFNNRISRVDRFSNTNSKSTCRLSTLKRTPKYSRKAPLHQKTSSNVFPKSSVSLRSENNRKENSRKIPSSKPEIKSRICDYSGSKSFPRSIPEKQKKINAVNPAAIRKTVKRSHTRKSSKFQVEAPSFEHLEKSMLMNSKASDTAGSLWLLLHAKACESNCELPSCKIMKRVLNHCEKCQASINDCKDACNQAKVLLSHHDKCKRSNSISSCPVCSLLKDSPESTSDNKEANPARDSLVGQDIEKEKVVSQKQDVKKLQAEFETRVERLAQIIVRQEVLQHVQHKSKLRDLNEIWKQARSIAFAEMQSNNIFLPWKNAPVYSFPGTLDPTLSKKSYSTYSTLPFLPMNMPMPPRYSHYYSCFGYPFAYPNYIPTVPSVPDRRRGQLSRSSSSPSLVSEERKRVNLKPTED